MPDTFQIYQSELTGPELDEALKNIALVQQSVADAAQSAAAAGESAADAAQAAQTAETYGAIVQQNQPAIQDIADNLAAVQDAAQNAQTAQSAAAEAAASAQEAEQWAEQAQQVAQGAMGWYADPQALQSAHPTGQNGQWAIVGTTDTIWIWDSDTSAWVDSGSNMDLSQYYTKTEVDARFLGAGDETVVRFVEISIDEETGAVTFTDPQFDFAFLAGCIRHDGETCVVRVKGVAATYSPNEWSEAEDGAVTLSFRDHGYIGDSSGQRVYRAPTLEITQRGGAVTGRRVTYIYNTLPSVDASDDGKTLRVVDGAWQVMTPPVYTAVFPASGWVEMDGGGYEQTAACAGMTADITPQPPTVQTTGSAEADKAALAALACIQAVQTLAGQVRALCYDAKPAADVTLCLTEVR